MDLKLFYSMSNLRIDYLNFSLNGWGLIVSLKGFRILFQFIVSENLIILYCKNSL